MDPILIPSPSKSKSTKMHQAMLQDVMLIRNKHCFQKWIGDRRAPSFSPSFHCFLPFLLHFHVQVYINQKWAIWVCNQFYCDIYEKTVWQSVYLFLRRLLSSWSNSEYMFLRDTESYTTIRARPVDTSCFRPKKSVTSFSEWLIFAGDNECQLVYMSDRGPASQTREVILCR